MRHIFLISLILFAASVAVHAQSGRRIGGPPVPAPTPAPVITPRTEAAPAPAQPSAGYSESLPNSPRSISIRDRKQSKPKEDKKASPTTKTGTADESEDEVLTVETNLVTVPVSVLDRQGIFVSDLIQKDFAIFENGVEQEVAYFGTSEQPFTVVLLLDVSPSTEYKIEEIQQAAIAFVEMLKPQDKVIVIQFDQNVNQLCDATTDREKIRKAIRRTGFGGGTSLYGAVDYTLNRALRKITGRKAVILFTDGVDTTSFRDSYERTVSNAEESDAVIYPIYFNTYLSARGIGTGGVMSTPPTIGFPGSGGGVFGGRRGASREEYVRGRAYLGDLASVTGGRVFSAESNQLMTAFEGIADELRYQYSIGYYPKAEGQTGEVRKIRVRVYRPKLVIRSRDSYVVGGSR